MKRTITAKLERNKTGNTIVDVGVIVDALPPPYAAKFIREFERFARQYRTQTTVYNVRLVMRFWIEQIGPCENSSFILPIHDISRASEAIKNLRRRYFEFRVARGKSLMTVNAEWATFIRFMKQVSSVDLFPALEWGARAYVAIKSSKIRVTARNVMTLYEHSITSCKTDFENDSYHVDLLESISIHTSDEEYLEAYEKRLRIAVDTFSTCALKDMKKLQRMRREGVQMLRRVDYRKLVHCIDHDEVLPGLKFLKDGGRPKTRLFHDSKSGSFVLENLLSIVENEMSGIPVPHSKELCRSGRSGERVVASSGNPHWKYVQHFGKNKLLPYLGILTAETAISLIVLLLIENASLNVESLFNAKLLDDQGQLILFQSAGDSANTVRLRVDKPRAGSEKHAVASDLTKEVIDTILLFTEKVRCRMKSEGRGEEANYLFLGMNNTNYNYGALGPQSLRRAFKETKTIRSMRSPKPLSTRKVEFLERHPELERWHTAALRSLRVSKGVLDWLEAGGDAKVAARSLGHRNIRITLGNYIPEHLQRMLYERQIRRHQNMLISAACIGKNYHLAATDFTCKDELNTFLEGLLRGVTESNCPRLLKDIKVHLTRSAKRRIDRIASNKGGVLVRNDPESFAVAIAYRQLILSRRQEGLRGDDRFWTDMIGALCSHLPENYHELRKMVEKAKRLAASFTMQDEKRMFGWA